MSFDESSSSRLAIGVDVGGTKTAVGLIDPATGALLDKDSIPTSAGTTGPPLLDRIYALVQRVLAAGQAFKGSPKIDAIGVGVPEIVDSDGQICTSDVINLKSQDVYAAFRDTARTVIEADVRAAAIAEAKFGAGRGSLSFVYISIGTGVSSTLVVDGVPLRGAHGAALVLASGPTTSICPHCGRVHTHVLEDCASGRGLAREYTRRSKTVVTEGREVTKAAEAGDATAKSVIRDAALSLGSAIGLLVNVTDPQLIILGGGLGLSGGLYRASLEEQIRRHIWLRSAQDVEIVDARLGPNAGVIGAAVAAATTAE